MKKDRIYVPRIDACGMRITNKDIIHKLKNVLRKKPGDQVIVFDGKGNEYQSVIQRITSDGIEVDVREHQSSAVGSSSVVLAFALIKPPRLEYILQKCTELGVAEFMPFTSCHTVLPARFNFKKERFFKIIQEASRQSGRLDIPILREISPLQELAELIQKYPSSYFADFSGVQNIPQGNSAKKALLFVGPEGGFSSEEIVLLREKGSRAICLSPFTLRSETACVSLVSIVSFFQEIR